MIFIHLKKKLLSTSYELVIAKHWGYSGEQNTIALCFQSLNNQVGETDISAIMIK